MYAFLGIGFNPYPGTPSRPPMLVVLQSNAMYCRHPELPKKGNFSCGEPACGVGVHIRGYQTPHDNEQLFPAQLVLQVQTEKPIACRHPCSCPGKITSIQLDLPIPISTRPLSHSPPSSSTPSQQSWVSEFSSQRILLHMYPVRPCSMYMSRRQQMVHAS